MCLMFDQQQWLNFHLLLCNQRQLLQCHWKLHKLRVTSRPEAADKETVKVALAAFSLAVVTSAIEMVGGLSSSVIVNVAELSENVAFAAFDRVMVAVSLASSRASARTGTLNVPDV